MTDPYKEWQERRRRAEEQLALDPADSTFAEEYWRSLQGGHDVRSGGLLIKAFRAFALKSPEGVLRLVAASRELADESGEFPKKVLIDKELLTSIRKVAETATPEQKDSLNWFLSLVRL